MAALAPLAAATKWRTRACSGCPGRRRLLEPGISWDSPAPTKAPTRTRRYGLAPKQARGDGVRGRCSGSLEPGGGGSPHRCRVMKPASSRPRAGGDLGLDAPDRHFGPGFRGLLRQVLADAVGLGALRPGKDEHAAEAKRDHLVIADEGGGGLVLREIRLTHRDLVDVAAARPAGGDVVDRVVAVGGVHQDHVRVLRARVVERPGDQRLVRDLGRPHDREALALGRQRRQLPGAAGGEILPGASGRRGLTGAGRRRALGRRPGPADGVLVAADGDVADGLEMLDPLVEQMRPALRLLEADAADLRGVAPIETRSRSVLQASPWARCSWVSGRLKAPTML